MKVSNTFAANAIIKEIERDISLNTKKQFMKESNTHAAVKDKSLGLETKGTKTLGLVKNFGTCLVSDENFWDSLVPVSSRWYNFYLVSSQSRPDLDE